MYVSILIAQKSSAQCDIYSSSLRKRLVTLLLRRLGKNHMLESLWANSVGKNHTALRSEVGRAGGPVGPRAPQSQDCATPANFRKPSQRFDHNASNRLFHGNAIHGRVPPVAHHSQRVGPTTLPRRRLSATQ